MTGLPRPFPFRGPPPSPPVDHSRLQQPFPFPFHSPTPTAPLQNPFHSQTPNNSRLPPPTAPLQNPFHSPAEFLRNNEGQRQNERNTNLNEQNQRNLAFTTRPQVSWYR